MFAIRQRRKRLIRGITIGILVTIFIGITAIVLLWHEEKSNEDITPTSDVLESSEEKEVINENENLKDEKVCTNMKMYLFEYIFIPDQIEKSDLFDIRIFFPNGEDYIVASGKCIEERSEQGVYINVTEDELFLISGAYVDTMVYEGAKMYASKYIFTNQELSYPNYPVNAYVSELAKWNPNLTEEMDIQANTEKRRVLEDNLFDFMGVIIGNSYSNMD